MKKWMALALSAVLLMMLALGVGCQQQEGQQGQEGQEGEREPVVLVGSQEFFDRPDAFPAFEEAYGFDLPDDQKIVLATGDTAVTERSAAEGTDGANAAMAYGTDGTISALDLVVLEDPMGVQPIYQPAPIFRKEVIDQYPEIRDILNPAFQRLNLETLQALNAQAAVEGQDPATIAQQWLEGEGLLGEGEQGDKGPITIGSKIDVEGPVLAQIMMQLLQSNGFEVVDQTRTGATDVVRNALLAGEIDGYPEYTANALTVFYPDAGVEEGVLNDAQRTYEEAARLDLENNDIVWLQPAPANNTWAIAIPREFSEQHGIRTLEDWANYINENQGQ